VKPGFDVATATNHFSFLDSHQLSQSISPGRVLAFKMREKASASLSCEKDDRNNNNASQSNGVLCNCEWR
jgi:hypothetical protein